MYNKHPECKSRQIAASLTYRRNATCNFYQLHRRLILDKSIQVPRSLVINGETSMPPSKAMSQSLPASSDTTITLALLKVDSHESVLQTSRSASTRTYNAYGYHHPEIPASAVLAFNGKPFDPKIGNYLLGNGHRAFSPVLMRFQSPDAFSPFNAGGINAYAYCSGDPINRIDPSGNNWLSRMVNKWQLKNMPPLTDVKAGKLASERMELNTYLESRQAQVSIIKHADFFNEPHINNSLHSHKWVLTQDRTLIVGSYHNSPEVEPSHSAFLAIAAQAGLTRTNVVAAGMLEKKGNTVQLTNVSGHFLPAESTLKPAANFIKNLKGWKASNLKVEVVRRDLS